MEKIGDILKKGIIPTLTLTDSQLSLAQTLPSSSSTKTSKEKNPIRQMGELTSLQRELGVVVPSLDNPYRNAECLTCRDGGWVHPLGKDGKVDYSQVVPCPDCSRATEGEDKTTRQLRLSGIPEARREYNFVSFLPLGGTEDALTAAVNLAFGKTETKWLLLYGGVGNGKTHLAIACGIEMLKRGIIVKFIKAADLLSELRKTMDNRGEVSCDEFIQYYKDVECLMLDDLGVEYETPWSQAKLEEIITSRWETKRYLIATTNKSIDDLSDRVRSRFLDPDLSVVARNLASDYRRRGK